MHTVQPVCECANCTFDTCRGNSMLETAATGWNAERLIGWYYIHTDTHSHEDCMNKMPEYICSESPSLLTYFVITPYRLGMPLKLNTLLRGIDSPPLATHWPHLIHRQSPSLGISDWWCTRHKLSLLLLIGGVKRVEIRAYTGSVSYGPKCSATRQPPPPFG